jgi:hypothetical protein
MKKILLLITLVLCYASANSQTTIIAQNSSWKYLDNGSDQGTAWRNTSFGDTSWASGNAELGYGDGGEATVVSSTTKPVTTYFRKAFTVSNPGLYNAFTLKLLRDDGAVVYLNGVEVARSNMPNGTINHTTLASSEVSGTSETAYNNFTINPSLFSAGNNVLAIELHQSTTNNIDLSFNLKLEATTGLCGTAIGLNASVITATTATLNWTAVPSVLSYSIQYRKTGTTTWTTVSASTNSKAITGLAYSSTYQFQVKGNCLLGGNYSAPATFTTLTPTCETPTALSASAVTGTSATLSWAAVSGASSYNIQYRPTGTATWTTTTATTTNKTITGLAHSTAYEFQVQAVCVITSAYSALGNFSTLVLSCGTPTGLTSSSITSSGAALSWTAVSGATSYKIQYRKTGTTTWTSTTSNTTNKTISSLSSGTVYEFQVQAVCAITSAFSASTNFTTLAIICATPNSLTTSSVLSTSATLSWQAVIGIASYNIQYRKTGTTAWTTTTATTNTKSITGLLANTAYQFQVQAVCVFNSSYSAIASFTTLAPCGMTSNLVSSAVTTSSVTLSWQAVSGATSYNIQYRPTGTTTWSNTTSTSNSKALTDLAATTIYEFQVQTVCIETSAFTASSTFTTLTPCGIPSGLSADYITWQSAILSWQAVSGATSYNIQYRPTGTTAWLTATLSNNTTAVSSLLAATNYEFQVQAVCSTLSVYSASGNFTTLPIPTCEITTGLNTTNITTSTALLSWQSAAEANGYNIQYRVVGSTTWNTATASTNSKKITGLLEGSTYEFQVQAACSVLNYFSPSATFTTLTSGTGYIIAANSTWKYLDNGTDQGTAWRANDFDDATWTSGNAKFGYGEGNETTIVNYGTDPNNKYVTTYFRKSFTISNPAVYSSLTFDLIRDDGAVVYLNGIEIYRNNLPTGTIAYNTLASAGANGTDESTWYPVTINAAQLLTGTNIIAVEMHQQFFDSSDLSFNGRLSGTIPPTCGTPTALTANTGSVAASLQWQAVNGATSYNVQFRLIGTETWTTTTAATNSKLITNLTPLSAYEYQVQAVCALGGEFSDFGNFTTTDISCNPPTNITVSAITMSAASLSWTPNLDANSYKIQYRVTGSETWTTVTTDTNTVQLDGLTLATGYDFQVQSVCSFLSEFSALANFTTAAQTCDAPTGLSISSMVSSTVTLNWLPVANAMNYTVDYQLAGTNAWISTTTDTNTKTITGLIAATGYEFRVKANCSASIGTYSAIAGFTTYPAGSNFLVATNAAWKYLDDGSNQDIAWRDVTFNDAAWKTGVGEFGYGDGDENTIVSYGPSATNKYVTTYFRKSFTINNPTDYSTLSLGIIRDDGAVVYLNGVEVWRDNMPAGPISYSTYAIESLGGSAEMNWFTTSISPTLLVSGENILAVEIHQQSVASSDLSFNGQLTAPSSTSTPIVTRGAYLQKLNSNSITIRWRTDIPSNTVVNYGMSIAYGNLVSDDALVTDHIITLSGLTPATKYFYSIGTTANTLQGDLKNNFITAPTVGTSIPVRIWGIGDFGNGTDHQLSVRNSYMNYTGSTPTNLWIWLGDDAYTKGLEDEFQSRVFAQYPDQFKNMPLFPTLGNHDYADVGYLSTAAQGNDFPYFSIFSLPQNGECGGVPSNSPKYYSYDYANIHFISIDTYGCFNTPGSPMHTWLQNDLAANTQKWTVVYMHHPPYTLGTHNSDTELELINARQNIVPLLESYKVDLVLAGHSHVNERSYMMKGHLGNSTTFSESMKVSTQTNNFVKTAPYDGTVYAVCGTSGQDPEVVNQPGYPMAAMYFNNNTNNCSLVIDVNGDLLSCKYLASSGTVVDNFTITKTGASARNVDQSGAIVKDALQVAMNKNTINLDYTLAQDSEVAFELMTLMGESIMTFNQIPNTQSAGAYNFDVALTQNYLAEGLYFIRMTINGKSMIKKVYVVK